MGFLNQSIAQIRELFASMTPAARITAALLLGVIGVSLGYLFQDYKSGSKEPLLAGNALTAGEANLMQSAIAAAGLNDYELQGTQIYVPRGQKAQYLAAVAEADALPANLPTMLLDETDDMSWFMDSKTRDARLKATRERMISTVIRNFDGITDAQVLYDILEPRGMGSRLVTATVSLRPTGEPLSATTIKRIRRAVCKSIAGLTPENVEIIDARLGTEYPDYTAVDPNDYEAQYYQTKVTYELDLKKRIQEMLDYVPGLRVQVSAELDDTLQIESRVITASDPQTLSEKSDNTVITDTQLEDRGPPGPSSQGPTPQASPEDAVAKNEHRTETNTRDARNLVPTTEELTQRAPMTPKVIRATINIPSDYIVGIWRAENPDADPDEVPPKENLEGLGRSETLRIQDDIAQLFPPKVTEAQPDFVKVSIYQSQKKAAIEEPSMAAKMLAWGAANSGSLIMAGLALVSLVMLRGMVKSIPSPETNVILSMPSLAAATAGGAEGGEYAAGEAGGGEGGTAGGGGRRGGDKGRPKLKLKKGPSLKDDLTDMVRDDPDAAAAILRTWISTAG